jgi:hypothetical protein
MVEKFVSPAAPSAVRCVITAPARKAHVAVFEAVLTHAALASDANVPAFTAMVTSYPMAMSAWLVAHWK